MHGHDHDVRTPDAREDFNNVGQSQCPMCNIGLMDNPVYVSCGPGEMATTAYLSEPRNPVVPGHLIFWPRTHFVRADEEPFLFGQLMASIATVAMNSGMTNYNLIVNNGPQAGQTVHHLHVHLIPRTKDDGLIMPWTNQKKAGESIKVEATLEWIEGFTCTCTHALSEHNTPRSIKRGCMKRGCKCGAEVQWVNH